MLTVDYERLDLRAGHRILDLGSGPGRHAFESLRRGAIVTAFDYDAAELKEAKNLFGAMDETGETAEGGSGSVVNGDGVRLPFPDETFDRIIAAEVLEHIPDDDGAIAELARVLKPGGTLAVTVPAWLAERICWAITDEYHAPFVEGGHQRIYTEAGLRSQLRDAGLEPGGAHHAHALHAPYWWLKCAVGPKNDDNPLVKAYHQLLVWDITKAPFVTRAADTVLNPLIGKSIVIYAKKPERNR